MTHRSLSLLALVPVALMSACAGMSTGMSKAYDQAMLPEAVKVPVGHVVALETIGVGEITYECKPKAATPGAFEWVFVGPKADLNSRAGAKLGTYYGPPATWAANDGSKITGTQVAVAPAGAGNIPSQLVKANPAVGMGAMSGISYVQRVATQGGVAPATTCDGAAVGKTQTVKYQADYIFYKAV